MVLFSRTHDPVPTQQTPPPSAPEFCRIALFWMVESELAS